MGEAGDWAADRTVPSPRVTLRACGLKTLRRPACDGSTRIRRRRVAWRDGREVGEGRSEFTYCMVTNGASGSQGSDMTRERLRDIRAAGRARPQDPRSEERRFSRVRGRYSSDDRGACAGRGRFAYTSRRDLHDGSDDALRRRVREPPRPHRRGEVVLRSINPTRRRGRCCRSLAEGATRAHKPKRFFPWVRQSDTIVDVSEVVDTKIKALLAHRSQSTRKRRLHKTG